MVLANLMGDIRPSIADVAVHLAHDADVLVAIQERVLLFPDAIAVGPVRCLVSLETGIGENDNETLGILVIGGNRDMLLGDKLRKRRRRKRLGSCRLELHGQRAISKRRG